MTSANGNIDCGKHIEIFGKKIVDRYLFISYIEIMFFKMTMPPSIDHDYSAPSWRKII
jgi:hypothetical protein